MAGSNLVAVMKHVSPREKANVPDVRQDTSGLKNAPVINSLILKDSLVKETSPHP
jgi:hypothetical protein